MCRVVWFARSLRTESLTSPSRGKSAGAARFDSNEARVGGSGGFPFGVFRLLRCGKRTPNFRHAGATVQSQKSSTLIPADGNYPGGRISMTSRNYAFDSETTHAMVLAFDGICASLRVSLDAISE